MLDASGIQIGYKTCAFLQQAGRSWLDPVEMAKVCVICFFHFTMYFQKLLSCLKVQKLTLGGPMIFVLLIIFPPFLLPTTGHGMVAVGSVGSGSCVIGFPIARLVSETLLATCGIPLGISLCLDTVLCGYVIWA